MARLPYLFSAVALASWVAACTVGDPNGQLPGDDDDDMPVDASTGGDGGGGGGDGGGNVCETLVTPAPDGHHNPGLGCIGAGCHDGNTSGAPKFVVAGTLYTTTGGTVPKAGATIILPTGAGTPRKLVTATNGNFWLESAVSPLPLRPKASLCPTTVQMTSNATDGNCNSCHGSGSRIALP